MVINSIHLKSFTVFENMEMTFTPGLNIVIGENGTGKTHLLKILYSICECFENNNDGFPVETAFWPKLMKMFQATDTEIFVRNKLSGITTIDADTDEGKYTFKIAPIQEQLYSMVKDSGAIWKKVDQTIFIPAKEMMTHSGIEKDYMQRNLPLDKTLIDILNKIGVSTVKNLPEDKQNILNKIAGIINGKVVYKHDRYFVKRQDGSLIDFAIEAEGYKKLGLIYRLIETGYLSSGSTLLWDEPESNLNPMLVPDIVNILLELSRQGVQIILATHDYLLAKYFEVKRTDEDRIKFHSLCKSENGVVCESNDNFRDLKKNPIISAYDDLLDEVIRLNLGD